MLGQGDRMSDNENAHEFPNVLTDSGEQTVSCKKCNAEMKLSGSFLGPDMQLRRKLLHADPEAQEACTG